MNKLKVLANGGVALFTTLSGLLSVDVLFQVNLPPIGILLGALIAGGIQAGLSMCNQILLESQQSTTGKKPNGNSNHSKLDYLTFF